MPSGVWNKWRISNSYWSSCSCCRNMRTHRYNNLLLLFLTGAMCKFEISTGIFACLFNAHQRSEVGLEALWIILYFLHTPISLDTHHCLNLSQLFLRGLYRLTFDEVYRIFFWIRVLKHFDRFLMMQVAKHKFLEIWIYQAFVDATPEVEGVLAVAKVTADHWPSFLWTQIANTHTSSLFNLWQIWVCLELSYDFKALKVYGKVNQGLTVICLDHAYKVDAGNMDPRSLAWFTAKLDHDASLLWAQQALRWLSYSPVVL